MYDAGGGSMGGFFYNNGPHAGTFLKDIRTGLQIYLNSRYTVGGGGWDTGTEGKGFAAGMNPTGGVAQILIDPASAFNEVTFEINRNHTLILCYLHWNIGAAPANGLPFRRNKHRIGFRRHLLYVGPAPGLVSPTRKTKCGTCMMATWVWATP